jgi:hypothetical protein
MHELQGIGTANREVPYGILFEKENLESLQKTM